MIKFLNLFFITVLLQSALSFAQIPRIEIPFTDSDRALIERTGFSDISTGSIVEGSAGVGRMQPDYIADFDSPAFDQLRVYANKLKKIDDVRTRINRLRTYMKRYIITNRAYNSEPYLELLKEYNAKGEKIPLSRYVLAKAGVCREHALIFNFALREAGIENYYLYSKIHMDAQIEDHAVNVVRIDGELRTFDSYNSLFNDVPLRGLLSAEGVESGGFTVGIVRLNNYPKVTKPGSPSCERNSFEVLNQLLIAN